MTQLHATLTQALQQPAPWLAPYRLLLQRVLRECEGCSTAAALNTVRDASLAVTFVEASELPSDEAYEAFIARTRQVPTRDNLHDLFNGLMWLCYPRTKLRLNQLQAQEIARSGTRGPRGALRDALTLFDENAALLHAPAPLLSALRARDWHSLFIAQRARWKETRLTVFGHALMEKLMLPRKGITAHVWVTDELTDASIASSLTPERLIAKDFCPLPLLGAPGWWAANEHPGFYDDGEVFRRPSRVPPTPE